MTAEQLSFPANSTPLLGKTLFDVGEAIFADRNLGEREICDIISSIRTFCRVLKRRPQHVPAALNLLRPMMDNASPEGFGVSSRRWQKVRQHVWRAIELTGFLG